jgi:hypothetical protein
LGSSVYVSSMVFSMAKQSATSWQIKMINGHSTLKSLIDEQTRISKHTDIFGKNINEQVGINEQSGSLFF